MRAEGHQVGNHTYDHTRLLEAEPEEVVEEIHKTEVLLTELLGEGDYWLRPPYGAIDETPLRPGGDPHDLLDRGSGGLEAGWTPPRWRTTW